MTRRPPAAPAVLVSLVALVAAVAVLAMAAWVPAAAQTADTVPAETTTTTIDPAVVAAQAAAGLRLPAPRILTSPPAEVAHLVNLPTWLWLEPAAPARNAATTAGTLVEAAATPVSVRFDTGDRDRVTCPGQGVPFDPARPAAAQPGGCTHTWKRSSTTAPGGTFKVTATLTWTVSWAGGTLGTRQTTATVDLAVAESQGMTRPPVTLPGQTIIGSPGATTGPGTGWKGLPNHDTEDDGGFWGAIRRGPGNLLDALGNLPGPLWTGIKAVGIGIYEFFEFLDDVVVGIVKGAWDLAVGLANIVNGLSELLMLQGPGEGMKTWRGLIDGVGTIFSNPLTTLKGIWDGFTKPMIDAWNDGKPGEAVGRGLFEVILLVFGSHGLDKVNKVRSGARGAEVLEGLTKTEQALLKARLAEELAEASRLAKAAKAAGEVGEEAVKKKWTIAQTRALGEWGEDQLAKVLNGRGTKPSSPFSTSDGNRFVDRLDNGIAHESKAGSKVKLTPEIKRQILKDAELVRVGRVDGAFWHFFQDADPKVLDFLTANNIPYKVYNLTAPTL